MDGDLIKRQADLNFRVGDFLLFTPAPHMMNDRCVVFVQAIRSRGGDSEDVWMDCIDRHGDEITFVPTEQFDILGTADDFYPGGVIVEPKEMWGKM